MDHYKPRLSIEQNDGSTDAKIYAYCEVDHLGNFVLFSDVEPLMKELEELRSVVSASALADHVVREIASIAASHGYSGDGLGDWLGEQLRELVSAREILRRISLLASKEIIP